MENFVQEYQFPLEDRLTLKFETSVRVPAAKAAYQKDYLLRLQAPCVRQRSGRWWWCRS